MKLCMYERSIYFLSVFFTWQQVQQWNKVNNKLESEREKSQKLKAVSACWEWELLYPLVGDFRGYIISMKKGKKPIFMLEIRKNKLNLRV